MLGSHKMCASVYLSRHNGLIDIGRTFSFEHEPDTHNNRSDEILVFHLPQHFLALKNECGKFRRSDSEPAKVCLRL